jgi:hypothetical protein
LECHRNQKAAGQRGSSRSLVDLSGLEFGNALLSALGFPKRTPVECMIAEFSIGRWRNWAFPICR